MALAPLPSLRAIADPTHCPPRLPMQAMHRGALPHMAAIWLMSPTPYVLPCRLYTVVPYLVKFIGNLTNIYVRYNRK